MSEKFGAEESKDQLENGVEKPISFELDETEKMRLKEMISEKVMTLLEKRIDGFSLNQEKQADEDCIYNFGLTWTEVRKQILDNTINPIILLKMPQTHEWPYTKDSLTIKPRELLKQTGDWMTNSFMEVLQYIYASGEKFDANKLELYIKSLNEFFEKTENQIMPEQLADILPVITNLAMPEKIKGLMEIHSDVIGDTKIPQIVDPEFEVKKRGLKK